MRVAAEYFERGEIFFRQSDLARRISAFLKNLPGGEAADESDGEVVLKAVEAQHGLFVERAHGIYSFSHLTLHEYFTARYIVDHVADGALERLITQHLTDDRWREVFLLTASMLSEADAFFATFQRALDDLLRGDERLLVYSRWAATKARDYAYLGHPAIARAVTRSTVAMMSTLDLACVLDHSLDRDITLDLDRVLARDRARDRVRDRVRVLDHALDLERILPHALDLTPDRDLAHALDRARDLTRDLALARNLTRDLVVASGVARDLTRALALALARIDDLDLTRALAHDFACDRAFIFAWSFARFNYYEGVRQLLAALAQASRDVGQVEFAQALDNLRLPTREADDADWQAYAADLQAQLIRYRNIGHNWNFTDEQQQHIKQYEQGTVLLAQCLKLAAVSDRKAIENRLLLPPEE
jgi:predicted NACHT family NTPase